jgi:hypothetical protein
MKWFKWGVLKVCASVGNDRLKCWFFLNADGFKERRQVPAGRKGQARKQYVIVANVNWKNKNPGDIHSGQKVKNSW